MWKYNYCNDTVKDWKRLAKMGTELDTQKEDQLESNIDQAEEDVLDIDEEIDTEDERGIEIDARSEIETKVPGL